MVSSFHKEITAKIWVLSLCSLTLTTCATRKEILAFKKDTLYFRMQIDSMRVEQRRLQLLVAKNYGLIEQNSEKSNKQNADLQIQIEHLTRQLVSLNDRFVETNHRISLLSAKTESPDPVSLPMANASDTTITEATPDLMPETSKTHSSYQFPGSVRLYDLSYQDLVKGNYDLARQGFMQYIRLLPDGELADDSQYWIGESYFAENDYLEAIRVLEKLLSTFPDSDRAPAAILKLAYCQIELGQIKTGKEKLALLIKKFPLTHEARLAQERLLEMN